MCLYFRWEERRDRNGRSYYVDRSTRTTVWERPETLPPEWERGKDKRGQTYYINNNTRFTTWQRPPIDVTAILQV